MQSITKDFPGVRALDDVSFDIRPGEIHALCGENGAGKSTLIKILGGVYPHGSYGGTLRINGNAQQFRSVRDAERAGIAIIYQELALIPQMTVGENIFLGRTPTQFGIIDWNRLYRNVASLMDSLGLSLPPQTPVHQLGIGQQQMVEIAKAISYNARLLVLDEPTTALTPSEVEALMQILRQLKSKNVSCIYITHKLREIFEIADRVTVLRDGKTVGTSTVDECDEDKLISLMVGRQLNDFFPEREGRFGAVALRVQNLNAFHPERSNQLLLKDISFEVRHGEILGIAGLMGAGRTELISAIFGAYPGRCDAKIFVDEESVQIRSPRDAIRHGIGLVSEDRKRYGLILDANIAENMTVASLDRLARYGVINQNRAFEWSNRYIESLQIKTRSLQTLVSHLSGGNQQKVVLGKSLMTQPEILLLDEPTRGIDVGAKAEVHTIIAQLAQQGNAIVMVSSDLPEILGMSDRILVLHEGSVTGEFANAGITQEDILRCAAGH